MAEGRGPARIRDLLGEVGSRFGLRDAVATGGLWSRWDEVVGDKIAAHAVPTSLRAGVLRVRVESPAWATELSYLAPEVIRRANESAGTEIVRELKVWVGPGSSDRSAARRPARGTEKVARTDAEDEPERSGDDPREAFESARRAWLASRSRKGGEPRR